MKNTSNLPKELWAEITNYLPIKSICQLSQTSQYFNFIVFNEHNWKAYFLSKFRTKFLLDLNEELSSIGPNYEILEIDLNTIADNVPNDFARRFYKYYYCCELFDDKENRRKLQKVAESDRKKSQRQQVRGRGFFPFLIHFVKETINDSMADAATKINMPFAFYAYSLQQNKMEQINPMQEFIAKHVLNKFLIKQSEFTP